MESSNTTTDTIRCNGDECSTLDVMGTNGTTWPSIIVDDKGTDESLKLFNFVVNVIVDGLLCLFGYLGNILTIVVLQKDGVRSSNAVLLQGIAVVDSCFLTYVVLYVVLRSVFPYTGTFGSIHEVQDYFVAFVLPFGWTSQTATIWMVMAVTVDRYIVVAHPFKANRWCTPSKARWTTAGVILAAIIFNIVRWPRYYFVAFKSSTASNSTFVSHLSADIPGWSEYWYRNVYHISLTFVMLFIIPLSVISVLNAWLIRTLRQATKARHAMTHKVSTKDKMSKTQKDQDKASINVTLMMVVMISIFVVCQLPDFIAGIIGAGNFKVDDTVYTYYAGIKEALLVFNAACNFYIYCIFYRRFRRTFLKLLGFGETEDKNSLSRSLANSASIMTKSNSQIRTVETGTDIQVWEEEDENSSRV